MNTIEHLWGQMAIHISDMDNPPTAAAQLHVAAQQTYVAYRQTSNIRRALVGNKIVDHSDVVGASPIGAAPTTPTTSSFSI